mgnify:CR=1 FL=1
MLTGARSLVDPRGVAEPKVTVVNPAHWLDEHGAIPHEPVELRNRALRVAQCIEYGGSLKRGHARETLIPCKRRPNRASCPGLMWVLKQSDDAILAFCMTCKCDEYLIYAWEETQWAEGPMEAVSVAEMAGVDVTPKPPGPESRDEQLARALTLIGSPLAPAEVRRMITAARVPSEFMHAVLGSCTIGPDLSSVERCIPVLINVWNEVQGQSPPRPPAPARKAKIGPNERCPCGSGKKYKRCCMLEERLR